MSDEKQVSLADIVTELRRRSDAERGHVTNLRRTGDDTDYAIASCYAEDAKYLSRIADRLEAAAISRERLLSKPPENDNGAALSCTADNKHGNAAAMREALEAARDLLLPQCNGGTAFAKACGETVNKIMDALNDERTSDGDVAAMREALSKLIAYWDWNGYDAMRESRLKDMARAALAAPPRNCDVGTAFEQENRFIEFCGRYPNCKSCPLRNANSR